MTTPREVFFEFRDRLWRTGRVVDVTSRSMQAFAGTLVAAEALAKIDAPEGTEPNLNTPEINERRELVEFTNTEVDRGFPFLLGQASVALWGLIEAFVEDFVVACFQLQPRLLDNEAVRKVKVSLAEYLEATDDERMLLLVQQLQPSLKRGINQFEELLSHAALDGAVDPNDKEALFELNNVRNVVVHRRSRADRRLAASCPWLQVATGDEIAVDQERYSGYLIAVMRYAACVYRRYLVIIGETEDLRVVDSWLETQPCYVRRPIDQGEPPNSRR